jgi:hypothetical protein
MLRSKYAIANPNPALRQQISTSSTGYPQCVAEFQRGVLSRALKDWKDSGCSIAPPTNEGIQQSVASFQHRLIRSKLVQIHREKRKERQGLAMLYLIENKGFKLICAVVIQEAERWTGVWSVKPFRWHCQQVINIAEATGGRKGKRAKRRSLPEGAGSCW